MKLLKGTLFLKVASLALALMTYFFIHREIEETDQKNSTDASYRLIKLTAKSVPVRPRLETKPPDGYRVLDEGVTVSPSQITVVGPEALLETETAAETSIIDISESTKTVTKRIPVESVAGTHLIGTPQLVDVTIPIEKIPQKPAEKTGS